MRRITHCDRSTLTEAWAHVIGRPAAIIPEEAAAIVLGAKREIPELQRDPAVIMAELPDSGPVNPFWNQQWSWNAGRFRARVGHRHLSGHCIANETHRYETFSRSLAPALAPWLDVSTKVYAGDKSLIAPMAGQVGFGYVNEFHDTHRYRVPVFSRTPRVPDYSELLGRTQVVLGDERTSTWEIGLARNDALNLELMTKKLMGVPLSSDEEAILAVINAKLRATRTPPTPESAEVAAAVEIAKRALSTRGVSRPER